MDNEKRSFDENRRKLLEGFSQENDPVGFAFWEDLAGCSVENGSERGKSGSSSDWVAKAARQGDGRAAIGRGGGATEEGQG